jgi:acetyl-CoA carboxylase carboxyl transferase subunit alpha
VRAWQCGHHRLIGERAQAKKKANMEATSAAQLELEKIEEQIALLESAAGDNTEAQRQLKTLEERVGNLRRQVTAAMGAWQKTELARHPQRPYMLDYVSLMFDGFDEIHGDRRFGDDHAMICGMAIFRGQPVLVVGQQKGRDVKQRVFRNFGQSSPEGYRKALRAMRMAEKFGHPILTFVDTPGAYPGLGAEERGQAEAIAYNLREMARIKVPVIVTITGEGGSGGALAIAIGDRILMLENSIYSVISPEGCASIMWRDATKRDIAAEALRITSKDMVELGVIDAVVSEPAGGAHRDPKAAADLLAAELHKQLSELQALSLEQLLAARYEKFRKMAQFYTEE